MQLNLLWEARQYPSLENALVTLTQERCEVNSIIIGNTEGKIFKVEYSLITNHLWQTISVEVKSMIGNVSQTLRYQSDGNGSWQENGQPLDKFRGCIDVDLPLTPFTNSLPINRLQLKNGEEKQVKVIYMDLVEGNIQPVIQKYKRLTGTRYRYENVPNDFEAEITVDEWGFVIDYPILFRRLANQ